VLTRSSLLVSHAGHGIVAKALYDGVPMGPGALVPGSAGRGGPCGRPRGGRSHCQTRAHGASARSGHRQGV